MLADFSEIGISTLAGFSETGIRVSERRGHGYNPAGRQPSR